MEFLRIIAPSIPSTAAVVVGFFVFHHLALRRQKRDEVRLLVEKIDSLIDQTVKTSGDCWKQSGIAATKDGSVSRFRYNMSILDVQVNSLIDRENKFSKIKTDYQEFKKNLDERVSGSGGSINLADINRVEQEQDSEHAIASASILKKTILTTFVGHYK